MKESRSGGQEQGILMGIPWAFGTPSQSPVPVGFTPALMPNCGTSEGSTARRESLKGPADTDTIAAEKMKAASMNFIVTSKQS